MGQQTDFALTNTAEMHYAALGYRIERTATHGLFLVHTLEDHPLGANCSAVVLADHAPPAADALAGAPDRDDRYANFIRLVAFRRRREPAEHTNAILVVPDDAIGRYPAAVTIAGHPVALRCPADLVRTLS